MDPMTQVPPSLSGPQFDPTNPKKPIYLSGAPGDTAQDAEAPPPPLKKPTKYSLVRLLIALAVFIALGANSANHTPSRLTPNATSPTQTTSGSTSSGNIPVGNYSGTDGTIPFNNQQSSETAPTPAKALSADEERKADITNMHTQLENYYQQHLKYPTLYNMNDANWRAINLKGLDKENLRDPASTSYVLAPVHAKNIYSYSVLSPTGGSCDNDGQTCIVYRLAAVLSDGALYAQDNLYAN